MFSSLTGYWEHSLSKQCTGSYRRSRHLSVSQRAHKITPPFVKKTKKTPQKTEELFKPMPNLHLLRRKKRMTVRDEKILYSSLDIV
jgi:hypothetical protein